MDRPRSTPDSLSLRRDQLWDGLIALLARGDSTYHGGLFPVAEHARLNDRLRRLFPFVSLNRLCFSRCSDFPYTNDCPAIGVDRNGRYGVTATCYPTPRLVDGVSVPLGDETDNPAEAVAIAAAHVPADAEVWLGSRTD